MNISDQITHVVRKARNDHRLPPSSRIPSPAPQPPSVNAALGGQPVGNWLNGTDTAQTLFAGVHTGTYGGNGEFTWAEGWDFGLADELFSSVTNLGVGTEVRSDGARMLMLLMLEPRAFLGAGTHVSRIKVEICSVFSCRFRATYTTAFVSCDICIYMTLA